MISISTVVSVVVFILIAGAVFALLAYLIDYVGRKYPRMEPFTRAAHVVLVVLGVLVLIGVLLSLAGYPVFRP